MAGAASTWKLETADTEGGAFGSLATSWTSIGVQAGGEVVVAYGRGSYSASSGALTAGTLRLATRAVTGTWSAASVDSTATTSDKVGLYTSMNIDATGSLHVAHYDNGNQDLILSARSSGGTTWAHEAVLGAGDVGQYPSVRVDTLGGVHVAYYNGSDKSLDYVHQAAGASTWTQEDIDTGAKTGQYAKLVLEPAGHAHVAYYDAATLDLKYAFKPKCP